MLASDCGVVSGDTRQKIPIAYKQDSKTKL